MRPSPAPDLPDYDQDYTDDVDDDLVASRHRASDAGGGGAIDLVPAREGGELES